MARPTSLRPWRLAFLLAVLLGSAGGTWAQSVANYTAVRTTSVPYVALTSPTSFASWRNGTNTGDNLSNATAIGFPFVYDGGVYTQFSASLEGFITFNTGTAATGNGTGQYGYQNTQFSAAGGTALALAPLYDDLTAGALTNVTYQLAGSSPNRTLTVQWITNTAANNFQVRLYESDNHIDFLYGAVAASQTNYTLGINGPTISATPAAAELLTLQAANGTTFSNTPANSLTAGPAANSRYSFTPPTTAPVGPVTPVFSGISYTGLTLTFTDNSTNETNFNVLRSADGGLTFTNISNQVSTSVSTAGTTYNVAQTGLTAGTTYQYQIYATTEGGISTALTASQATLAPIVFNGTAYTIDNSQPTSGTNFTSFTDAFAAINVASITANTTISVVKNTGPLATYNEAPLTLTFTGASGARLTFQSATSNAGNPVVQGTQTTGGTSSDAIITLSGSDYITFDGIDLKDNPANSTAALKMERGLFLNAPTATNGCQNVTYQNGTITLDKTNTNAPVGIYTSSIASAASGANSSLSFLNNTIQNVFKGYQLTGSGTALDQNNMIGTSGAGTSMVTNVSSTGSVAAIGVDFNAQNLLTVANTTFSTFSASSSAGPLYGVANTITASTNVTIGPGNTFTGFTSAVGSIVSGVYFTTAITGTVNGNTVTLLTNSVSGGALYGIFSSGAGKLDVYDNQINNLSLTAATNSAALEGIDIASTNGQTQNMYRNTLHTIVHSSTTAIVYGIRLANGSTAAGAVMNVYNNLLSNISAHASNGGGSAGVRAISISTAGTVNLYYNSVYLSGAATNANAQTGTLYTTTGSISSVDFRNNIFVNKTTGGLRHVGIYRSGSTVTVLATTSNNNLLYGTSGLYYDGTTLATALAAYRLAVNGGAASTPRETAAVTESTTPFTSATDPHLTTATPTQAESGAQRLTGPSQSGVAVADDYDVTPRQGETGYTGTGSAPDIGADEGNFTPNDLTPPTITYMAIANTASTANQTLLVTITDASGIATGTGAPLIYYRKGTSGSYFSAVASVSGNQYTFTIDYANVTGGSVTGGDVINYYVAAQDASSNNNLATSPTGGSGITPPGSTAPTSPATYTILESFSGTVSVGPGQTYNGQPLVSLTAANGLFARLNAGVLTGNLTVLITGDISIEDGTNVLKPLNEQPAASNFAISIQPSAATERLITGAGNSMGLNGIILNGADRVTFDGRFNQTGTTKYLRFRSIAASSPVFTVQQDAVSNTFRDCYVEGGTTSFSNAVIFIGNSTVAAVNTVPGGVTGNDNTSVLNCDIFKAAAAVARPGQGIYSPSPGVTAAAPDNVTISGNNLYDWDTYGIISSGAGNTWTISGNSFYQTSASASTSQWAMNLGSATSATGWAVSGNYIGGTDPQAGGAAWVNSASAVIFKGIHLNGLGTANAPSTTVSGNFIRNISLTGTGSSSFSGIEVKSDNTSYNITGNVISNITSATTQANGTGGAGLAGIYTQGTNSSFTAQVISNNTVSGLAGTAAAATANNYVTGILAKNSSGATGTATRNRVFDLSNSAVGTPSSGVIGINLAGGTWTVTNNQVALSTGVSATPAPAGIYYGIFNNVSAIVSETVYFNSVRIGGVAGTGTAKTYAFNMGGTASSILRNNVLVNERTGGGGNFAIGVPSGSTFGTGNKVDSNRNDLFATENPAKLGETGITAFTFAAWKAQTGTPDASSQNVNAKFVDIATGNLNLDATTNCSLNNAGVAIATIDGEYDNAATSRQGTPDIGSDEFTPITQTATITTASPACGPTTASVTITGNGGPFSVTYTDGTTPVTTTANASPFTFSAAAGKTYTLTSVTDAYGCTLTTAGSLTVNPPATADAGPATAAVCAGYTYSTVGTFGGSATQATYTSSGTGTFSNGGVIDGATASVTYSPSAADLTAGNVTLTLTPDNPTGCAGATADQLALTLNPTTTWTGAADSEWNNPANWSGGCVPKLQLSAVVPTGTPNSISDNGYANSGTTPATVLAQVKTLTINADAFIELYSHNLNIAGDLVNNGDVYLMFNDSPPTGNRLRFVGAAPQSVTRMPEQLYSLEVAKSGNNVSVLSAAVSNGPGRSTGTDFRTRGPVTMTSGLLDLGSTVQLSLPDGGQALLLPSFTFGPALSETDASYVVGKVRVTDDLSTAGSGSSFGNLGLTLTPDAASTALPGTTAVVRTTGTVLTGAGTSVSIKRYFDIQPNVNTGLNVAMNFSYFDHERNGIAAANVALFKSVSGTSGPWANQQPISIAGNTVSKTGITDFSIWTLGSASNPLPVELTVFTADRQGSNATLAWTTAMEKSSRGFEVQMSTDGRTFRVLDFVASATPTSTGPRSYSYLDREAGKTGLRYYRLRQLDLNGTASFSPVRTVRFGDEAPAVHLTAAPNPFQERLTLTVELPANTVAAPAQLSLTDAAGRVLLQQSTPALPAGLSQLELPDLAKLASGVYIVNLAVTGRAIQHLKVVKE